MCPRKPLHAEKWESGLNVNICVKSAWFYSFCTRFKTHEKHPRCTSVHIWALFNSSIQSFLPISRLSSSLSLGKYLSVCSCSASSCQEPVRGGSSPFRLQCNERLLPEGGMDRSQNCCITEQLLFFFFSVAKYCKVMPRDTCLTCCYFFSPKSVFILWTLWGEVTVTESTFWIKHFVQKLDKDSQKGRLLHVRWISHLLLCGKMFSLSPCQMSLP